MAFSQEWRGAPSPRSLRYGSAPSVREEVLWPTRLDFLGWAVVTAWRARSCYAERAGAVLGATKSSPDPKPRPRLLCGARLWIDADEGRCGHEYAPGLEEAHPHEALAARRVCVRDLK